MGVGVEFRIIGGRLSLSALFLVNRDMLVQLLGFKQLTAWLTDSSACHTGMKYIRNGVPG